MNVILDLGSILYDGVPCQVALKESNMERWNFGNIATAFSDHDEAYSNEICDLDYSQLESRECHDCEELHEMRQMPGYDPATCRVVKVAVGGRAKPSTGFAVVVADHSHERLLIIRAGFSQAPPPWICEANDNAAVLIGRAA